MGNKKNIGLVLSFMPGYSETFFKNKINGLLQHDHKVILFLDYKPSQGIDNPDYKIKYAPVISGKGLSKYLNILFALLNAIFLHPNSTFKLWKLDSMDNKSTSQKLRTLIANSHILGSDVDWLHFGFGTLAYGRENLAEAIGAQMGVSFRGFDLYLSPLKHPNCFKLLFKKDIRYHVLSHEMKDDLVSNGINSKNIAVIPPAIDTAFFSSVVPNTKTNNAIRFLTVARLHWKKGLVYTLEALSVLKKDGLLFTYNIVGEGEQLERLVFAVHQLDLVNEVNFLGKLSPKAVRQEMQSADVYLQYSIQEGFCNSVLEAQSMGMLCIVSNAEGLSENVVNGKSGWVVPKRKPDLLAKKIKQVLELEENKKESIRSTAITRVRENFGLEQQQDQFVNFFNQ